MELIVFGSLKKDFFLRPFFYRKFSIYVPGRSGVAFPLDKHTSATKISEVSRRSVEVDGPKANTKRTLKPPGLNHSVDSPSSAWQRSAKSTS